jgi:hypothetical protein
LIAKVQFFNEENTLTLEQWWQCQLFWIAREGEIFSCFHLLEHN